MTSAGLFDWLIVPWTIVRYLHQLWALNSIESHLRVIEREPANRVGPKHRRDSFHQYETELIKLELIRQEFPWTNR